jgi:4-hydroxy-tetrahydrodipicolinate synthase
MHKAWRAGRVEEATAIQDRLVPLHDALFCETSPGPVKYAASLLAKSTEHCRLPMAPIAESSKARVREAMVSVGLLN